MNKLWPVLLYSNPWSYALIVLLALLGTYYALVQDHTDTLWQWIDPVAGIMTFVTTLFIFGIQAKSNWEDSLDKLLSVDYIYTGEEENKLIAQVEKAYLAAEADMRQWAQSLGGQIMGNLDFDLNWDETKLDIIHENGQYYKPYHITIYLTTDPRTIIGDNRKGLEVMKSFLERRFKYSSVSGSVEELPIKWSRNDK